MRRISAGQALGRRFLSRDARVVQHQRVQVAVAGVEDVGDAQARGAGQRLDLGQHARDLGARDDAVLHDVVGRQPSHRRERALAPLPHQLALVLVGRHAHLDRARARGDRQRLAGGVLDLGARSVDVHQQHGAQPWPALEPVDADRLHRRLDRQPIHHLDRRRHDAAADDLGDAAPGLVGRREGGQEGAGRLGPAQDAQHDLGHDAERPFAADQHPEQIVTGWIQHAAVPDIDDVAVGGHQARAPDVVDREAVLEAVRAAGVLGDVAADGADALR